MVKGGMCGEGGIHGVGACMAKGCAWWLGEGGMRGHCSGRYTSSWNVFLVFSFNFTLEILSNVFVERGHTYQC